MPKSFHIHLRGFVGYWNFSKEQVAYILDNHKDEEVHVLIDSTGGYAYEALSISALFKNHGNVHVHYIGANASAATIASMGAKHVSIDTDALYLVHKCKSEVFAWRDMNEDEIARYISDLEKLKSEQGTLNGVVANMYARRCKKSQAELMALMSEDRWLTAKEALDWGFVDEITDDSEDKKEAMTKAAVEALANAGLPIPPNSPESSMPKWLRQIINAFSKKEPSAVEVEPNTPIMQKKEYPQIGAVAGSVNLVDGKAELAEESLDKIEAKIVSMTEQVSELTGNIASRDAKIAELEAKVADLAKEPAEPANHVADNGGKDDLTAPTGNMKDDIEFLMSL